MKKILHLMPLLIITIFLLFSINKVYGDELDDINKQINDLKTAYNQSKAATAPLEKELKGIIARVAFIETDLINKKAEIDTGYKDLAKQTAILNATIKDFYIKSYYNSPLLIFLSSKSANEVTQALAYQKAATDQDKVIITNIVLSIADLEGKKKNLEEEQIKLDSIKVNLDKIVIGAKAYQSTLSGQIAALSARQQQILGQRLANLHIPRSAGSGGTCSSDLTNGKSAGFSGGFGLFTYGVPNRVGLSQYGAFGRAKDGKLVEDILKAYYDNYDLKKDYSQDIIISVEGGPSLKIEEYMLHIGEVPESWGDNGGFEALKAQAIAARSYALAYTNNGQNSICGTDSCQVFLANAKEGKWKEAVEATRGWVMVQGGQPIKSWFSSAHGGYIHSSGDIGWSSTSWTKNAQDASGDISSFADLTSRAYDSPSHTDTTTQSFYCDWGARSAYGGTAWLKPDEIADIVNTILLNKADSSTSCHTYQIDQPTPSPYQGCPDTSTWDAGRIKQELQKYTTPFNSISSISISADFGSGKTTSVNVSGDAGSQSFNGTDFKNGFNLRAPANIQIVGPLYNIERK